MAFLLVKVCALAACSCTTWKCVPLLDLLLYKCRTKWPTTYTSDAVTACTPVTLFFPLGVQLCSNKTKQNTLVIHNHAIVSCTVLCWYSMILYPGVYNIMRLPSLSPSSFLPPPLSISLPLSFLLPPHCFYPGVDFFKKTIELEGKRIKLRIVYVIWLYIPSYKHGKQCSSSSFPPPYLPFFPPSPPFIPFSISPSVPPFSHFLSSHNHSPPPPPPPSPGTHLDWKFFPPPIAIMMPMYAKNWLCDIIESRIKVASFPGHIQILSHSCMWPDFSIKSGSGLGTRLGSKMPWDINR